MKKLVASSVCALLMVAAFHVESQETSKLNARCGINFEGPKDWSRAQAFLNVMKTARAWISQSDKQWDDKRPLSIDSDGYVTKLEPGQMAATLMLTEVGEKFPGGEYVFLYDGEGDFEWKENAKVLTSSPGRHVVQVSPAEKGFVQLVITRVNPENYPKNMRFVKAEYEKVLDEKHFSPWLFEFWGNFNTVRFMNWTFTNNSKMSSWSERAKPSDRTYSEKGVPYEDIIRFCNTAKTNAWICIPHLADDEYIRETAKMFRDGLATGLTTYYEFSNEVWNGIFGQTKYAQKKGKELNLAPEDWKAGLIFYSQECERMFKILDEVYAGKPRSSYRKVIATQAANIGVAKIVAETNELYKKADVLAIAPYLSFNVPIEKGQFNPLIASEVENWTLDQLFEYLNNTTLPKSMENINEHKQFADRLGLTLVAYEGGQHLTALGEAKKNSKLVELLTKANRDKRMGELYTKYLNHWNQTGADLFCLFEDMGPYSIHGSWGLLEYVGQDPASSPKFQAVKKWAASLPKSTHPRQSVNPVNKVPKESSL